MTTWLAGIALSMLQAAPPSTDVWLVASLAADPINITDRDGYDNQPHFTSDGRRLLYTSSRGGQTDIFVYDLASGEARQLTATPESEYSPTPTDETGFSVVRVEADGKQRLWSFDWEGKDPRVILEDVAPVGYHAWIDGGTLALFVLGDPPTLQVADIAADSVEIVARSIGRSLHRVSTNTVGYVDKSAESWVIRTLDVDSGATTALVATRPGREDFAITGSGNVLMADGTTIYRWSKADDVWTALYDFGAKGITNISRLAVASDGSAIAFVADR